MVDIIQVYYSGSSPENNVKRIGDKSLSFPDEAKGKRCVFVSKDVYGDWWWQLMWQIWEKNYDGTYKINSSYQATINNKEEKIEITYWDYLTHKRTNLNQQDKDRLSLALLMLCFNK